MIQLKNVTFRYENIVLNQVNISIQKSKITFIIGANGSGKSTLAQIICGLLFPKEGKVQLDDIILNKKMDNKLIRKKIGMVFQNPNNQIFFPKVYDDIAFVLKNLKTPKELIPSIIQDSLKKVNMLDFINSNSYHLSGGQKQKVAIASQLALDPDYLVLDEVTSMLDSKGKKDIYSLLKKLKKDMGIIFITNNMDELIYADDIIVIDNQKAYHYTLVEVLKNYHILIQHDLEVPFLLQLVHTLNIKNTENINENMILERIQNL